MLVQRRADDGWSSGETVLAVAPRLRSGMFRGQTIAEVHRVLEVIRGHEAEPDPDASAGAILEALEELADCVVDREVLERTSVGKEVKRLQRSTDSQVAKRAATLCEQWRRDFDVRKKVVEGFMEKGGLKRREARDLEDSLFDHWCPLGLLEGAGYDAYRTNYKRLCTHLRTRGPGSLVQRLQDGYLSCTEAAALPDAELLSNEQLQHQKEAEQEGLKNALAAAAEPEGTVTSDYTCPKCQSTRSSYKELQTGWHSDQQDLTIIAQCLDCGERWKASDDHGLAGS